MMIDALAFRNPAKNLAKNLAGPVVKSVSRPDLSDGTSLQALSASVTAPPLDRSGSMPLAHILSTDDQPSDRGFDVYPDLFA